MAGATSQELLARVRSLIGEPSQETWHDEEIYSALTAAQLDLITVRLGDGALFEMSEIDEELLVAGTNVYDLPSDFVRERMVEYKGIYSKRHPARYLKALGEGTATANAHYTPSETNPFWRIHAGQVVHSVGTVTQANGDAFNLWYISSPAADISSTADPELGTQLQNLLVWFAVSRCMEQSGEPEIAAAMMAYYKQCCSLINKRYHDEMPADRIPGDPTLTYEVK